MVANMALLYVLTKKLSLKPCSCPLSGFHTSLANFGIRCHCVKKSKDITLSASPEYSSLRNILGTVCFQISFQSFLTFIRSVTLMKNLIQKVASVKLMISFKEFVYMRVVKPLLYLCTFNTKKFFAI